MGNDDFSGSCNKQTWICALTHYSYKTIYFTADKETVQNLTSFHIGC